jgi:hypothetical protein
MTPYISSSGDSRFKITATLDMVAALIQPSHKDFFYEKQRDHG